MKRREIIASIGASSAAFSGCIVEGTPVRKENNTDMGDSISIIYANKKDLPEEYTALETDVRIDSQPSNSSPGVVATEYRNPGDSDIQLPSIDRQSSPLIYSGEGTNLVLIPQEGYRPERDRENCWKLDEEGVAETLEIPSTTLESKSQIIIKYGIWLKNVDEKDCIKPGQYEFSNQLLQFGIKINK